MCFQCALFKLLHSWQKELDNSGFIGTILTDLSKAYDCLPHDLIIAKFEAYSLRKNSLKLLLGYLEGRKQCVKIGSSCSFRSDIKRGVPQGSTLVFNVFINDLFMFIENCEICNFADDNTLYSGGMELSSILEDLRHDTKIIIKWFRINSLKANTGKFQSMILGKKQCNKVKLKINSILINESDTVELLGITIDNMLTFNEDINNLCRNASYKLYALRRTKNTCLRTRKNFYIMHSLIASLITRQLLCFVERINILKFKKFIIKHLRLYSTVTMAMMNYFK